METVYLHLVYPFCNMRIAQWTHRQLVIGLSFLLAGRLAVAQANPTVLSPSEAYKEALAPFNAAKAQQDDLTDADRFALEDGMAIASRDCLAISAKPVAFADNDSELIALGQLCIFGQQYEPARSALVTYLGLPNTAERKLALVLLVRAFLGLQQPVSAEAQVRSLLRDYPYDAQTHFAIDQVLDALEGVREDYNDLALGLCTTQNAATLPLLESGKSLKGKELSASARVLFADAVRCAAVDAELGTGPVQDNMHRLSAIVVKPDWAGTADLAPMQAALARQQMIGTRVPMNSLHGSVVSSHTLVPRTVPLAHGTVLLMPFTLWSPSAFNMALSLSRSKPNQHIYAITSWSANTGQMDAPSNQILAALRLWQQPLPPQISMIVVPDSTLRAFHADTFPAGIAIRDGVVRSNSVLSSQGAERLLFQSLTNAGLIRMPAQ
jgi:hypothetical protein